MLFSISLMLRRPSLQKILRNVSWLAGENVLRLGLGITVGIAMARYLGPSQFGILSFASSIVAICGVFANLGLQGILVKELVRTPNQAPTFLGTSFLLQFVGGLVGTTVAWVAIYVLDGSDTAIQIALIISLALPFRAAATVKYWFESLTQSKFAVLVESATCIVSAAAKLWLVITQAPLHAFAWLLTVEAVASGVALVYLYHVRTGALDKWRVSAGFAKDLLVESWPLILSSLVVMMYMRLDQIMLAHIVGHEAVGVYAAATRISEAFYFLPTVITASAFPAIMRAGTIDSATYHEQIQRLYDVVTGLSIFCAIPLTLLAPWLIRTLYGSAFIEGGTVLIIHAWTAVFAALSVSSGRWMIDNGLAVLALRRNVMGLVANVGLNLVLIPSHGPAGAAVATLCSLILAAYLSDLLSPRTRVAFRQKTRALFGISILRRLIERSPLK